jgi:alpha-tubulin suppressor-like RCC1 family protein
VPIPDLTFTDIAAGANHSCGIATNGKTYCWGDGFSGQLGYGQLSTESSPTEVNTGVVKFTRILRRGRSQLRADRGRESLLLGR